MFYKQPEGKKRMSMKNEEENEEVERRKYATLVIKLDGHPFLF